MSGPWERYAPPAPEVAGPWTQYAPQAAPFDPTNIRAATGPVAGEGPPGVAEDIAGSIQGGIIRGAASLPGLPGSVTGLLDSGVDAAVRHTAGRLYNRFAPGGTGDWSADARTMPDTPDMRYSAVRNLPTATDTVNAAEALIGKTYRPQTTPGHYAATAAEFVGGGARPLFGITGGLASEGAGQMTQGTPYEMPARLAAALAAPMAVSRAVSPIRTDAARRPLVEALEREGVELTAGQRTGSRPLQYAESSLSDLPGAGGAAAQFMERQGRQFNSAAARRMGEDADMLTPDVMARADARIGREFDRLSAQNTLRADQPFVNELSGTAQTYSRILGSEQREKFNQLLVDITGKFQNGAMPGVEYQLARSRLSRISHNNRQSDPDYSEAVGGLRNALDGAMGRSIAPADQAAWEAARREYGNMKTLERAMAGGGERVAQGFLSPLQLRAAASARNQGAYVRGEGDFAELARAGAGVMAPLPQSGTAPRMASGTMAGMVGGAALSGSPGITGSAVAAALAPALAGRAIMTGPAQSYLGNNVMAGADSAQQALARALLSYQPGQRDRRQ